MYFEFASLLNGWGLSGSATTGGPGFALSTDKVESKLCDEGIKEGTKLDGKSVCFVSAVGSHVFISVHLILCSWHNILLPLPLYDEET